MTACGQQHTNQHQSKKQSAKPKVPGTPFKEVLLVPDSITKIVERNHARFAGEKGDFNSFKKLLQGLDDRDAASIPVALDYVETALDSQLPERDSVVILFNQKFYTICNGLTDSLETRYAKVVGLIDKGEKTEQTRLFRSNLRQCGIGVFESEGSAYLDILPDYLYKHFQNRVSPAVERYLSIRRDELAQGFSEDAGMLISFQQLYDRVKTWESFLNSYPANVYTDEAESDYETYLETLMTGMGNSRVFDLETDELIPEVKDIYEREARENPESRTGKIIGPYVDFLARHNFKYTDSVDVFLKERHLSTMLGVQPPLR